MSDWLEGLDIEIFVKKLRNRTRKIYWGRSINKVNKSNGINDRQKKIRPDLVSLKRKEYGINKKILRFDDSTDFNESEC